MTITQNFATKLFGAVVAIAMVFALVAPAAHAQSESDLQQMINDLLAQVASLQSQLGQGQSTGMGASDVCPYAWTRDLSQGSTGNDVLLLQQFLNADPDTRVAATGVGSAGQETDYYGALTAAAVSKFQVKYRSDILSPLGLVNPTGYFGAGSRAKANDLCVTPTPTPTPDEDEDEDEDEEEDDEEVDDSLQGEGTLDVFEIDDASDDEIEEGSEDEPIAELTMEAENGDIEISRMDIALVGVNTPTEADPWDVFETISLWVDGDMVAEFDEADDEDEYLDEDDGSIRFSRLGLILREGDEVEMTIAASVQGHVDGAGTDADWTVSVEEVRYFDADGVATDDDDTDEIGDTASFSIVEEGEDDELIVRSSTDDPDATTLQLEDDQNSDWITIFAFDLDTDDSTNDIEVTEITMEVMVTENDGTTATSSAFLIDDAQLVVDGAEFDDVTITHNTDKDGATATGTARLVFDLDDEDWVIDAGDEVGVELQIEFEALRAALEGATVRGTVDGDYIDAEGADDLDATALQGSATGDKHTVRTEGAILEFVSESFVEKTNSDSTIDDDQGVFTLKFDVTAFETDVFMNKTATRGTASTTSGVEYLITSGNSTVTTGTTTASLTSTADTESGDFRVSEGETETFTLKVTFDPATSDFFAVQLNNINFATAANAALAGFTAQNALPVEDFDTDEYNI